jgi:hypothetical protein
MPKACLKKVIRPHLRVIEAENVVRMRTSPKDEAFICAAILLCERVCGGCKTTRRLRARLDI